MAFRFAANRFAQSKTEFGIFDTVEIVKET
jgi:hypothetical protein